MLDVFRRSVCLYPYLGRVLIVVHESLLLVSLLHSGDSTRRRADLLPLCVDIIVPLATSLFSLFGLGVVKGVFGLLLLSGVCAVPVVVCVVATRSARSPVWGVTLVLTAMTVSSVTLGSPIMVLVLLLLGSLVPVLLSSTSGRMSMLLLFSSMVSACSLLAYVSCVGSWSSAIASYV